jgi:hypothetical protein
VRALIEQGDLDADLVGGTYLVHPESLARLAAHSVSGRSLSARMSWAALMSDLGRTEFDEISSLFGLTRADRHRVVALRDRPLEDWSWLARRRAVTTRHTVRDAYLDRLVNDSRVIKSGLSALGAHRVDLRSRRGDAELYVAARDVDDVLARHLARIDPAGHAIVHAVDDSLFERIVTMTDGTMNTTTVGVDLAESADIRTQRAGHRLLSQIAHG